MSTRVFGISQPKLARGLRKGCSKNKQKIVLHSSSPRKSELDRVESGSRTSTPLESRTNEELKKKKKERKNERNTPSEKKNGAERRTTGQGRQESMQSRESSESNFLGGVRRGERVKETRRKSKVLTS